VGGTVTGRHLFVNEVGSDGWLQARRGESGPLVSLAKYTEVVMGDTLHGRKMFKVVDGPARGQTLSLADTHVSNYLGTRFPTRGPLSIEVTYGAYVEAWVSAARNGQQLVQQMATLKVKGITAQVTMNSVWGREFAPLPAGQYAVRVPDAPHKQDMTRFYRRVAPGLKYDQVWFPIRYGNNSRDLHVGNLSDGCVTVLDLDKWPAIHEALISHRSADGQNVAQLIVRGTPGRSQ
jgi:hypothetical protein